ncbi:MAG TPA: translocation/assembly module TamB domain-containing protein [Terriglobales bacterium]|nr:translocation/assembly module TamB domain-containing protein [Terriglobales bacterium]
MNWKRTIGWSAGIIMSLLLVVFVAGYFAVKSEGFHQYVLAKIVQQGNEATGGKVEVRNFDFRVSTLTAHVYGFVIHGTEPDTEKPLLQVDKLTVGLKILSVLHHHVNLSELLIEHPVIHLAVDKNGLTNIPVPTAPKNKSSQTNIFDLAVGRVLLTNGEIDYNDRKTPMNADVRDLIAETHFNSLTTSYAGEIKYQRGHIQYAGLAPLPHGLVAQFDATPSALNLSSLVLTVGSSRIALQANVTQYNNPEVQGIYNILIHSQDVAGLVPGSTTAGDVLLSGKLTYQSTPDHPFLRDVALDGRLSSDILRIASPQGRMELRKLNSGYQLADGNFRTSDFAVELLNGRLAAALTIQHLDAAPSSKLHASLRGISLQDVKASLNNRGAKTIPVAGALRGTADVSWTGSMQNLRARSDLEIRPMATNSAGRGMIPVSGAAHVTYDGVHRILAVRQSTIHTPRSSISAEGQISDQSNLILHASTSDLHELAAFATIAQSRGASPGAKPPQPLNASGAADLSGVVTGSWQRPHVSAKLDAQHLAVEGSEWRRLSLTAQASPSKISIQNGSLISARQGQLSFSASVGLRNWSYIASYPIAVNVSVKQLPVGQIEQLARLQYPVEGNLSGDISLRGSELNPIGSGSLRLTEARLSNEPVRNLAVQFHAANGTINSSLNVSLSAGSASADLTFVPKTKEYKFKVDTPGIVLNRLQAIQEKNLGLNGTLTASASGQGTLENPALTASIQLPQLQFRENSITGIKADLRVSNHRANLVLRSDVAQSTVSAHAIVNLMGDYYTEATIDTTRVPLAPLLAIYAPSVPTGFQGATELHATLKGPLKDKAHVEAHIVIPTLTASYQTLQVANSGPIRLDYANSVIVIQPSEIKGTDTALQLRGRIPIGGTEPMSAFAKGTVDLRLLQIIDPDVKSSGTIALDVNTQGTASHPTVQGQIQLKEASLYTASAPLGLGRANAIIDIGTDQARITQFTGQVGGGEVSAGGTITYRPQIQFNLAMQAQSVRLLYPEGLRTVLGGSLNLTGNRNDATLEGRVLVDSLSFTSDFDISTFMSQFTGPSIPPTSQTFADAVKLNISIQSTGQLEATSSQVSLQGQANLRAIGTAADPVIVGRADLNSGDVFFLNNRYQLQRGVFTFNNPTETEPTVNLAATTTIAQYNLTINVNGPINKLQSSYVSDPPLSTVDIINLIARGQTTQQADTTNLSANSLIAQGVASQLSSGVQKLAGLSSLSIDPLLGGNNSNPSARIAVQQRLTKNFFFTFSTDVTQPQSEIIQGEYQVTKRWSVSVNRDASGGIAVDGKFHTNF